MEDEDVDAKVSHRDKCADGSRSVKRRSCERAEGGRGRSVVDGTG